MDKQKYMILTDSEIYNNIESKKIVIEPFDPTRMGSNSYDLCLGKDLAVYTDEVLDAKKDNNIFRFEIPEDGLILYPNVLYLGVTEEYTETHEHIPFFDGKSSIGRLGIVVHQTAGKGDIGFCGYWTLEISVLKPVKVYAGMPIGQIIYFEKSGDVLNPYNKKINGKYNNNSKYPQKSLMFKNFI